MESVNGSSASMIKKTDPKSGDFKTAAYLWKTTRLDQEQMEKRQKKRRKRGRGTQERGRDGARERHGREDSISVWKQTSSSSPQATHTNTQAGLQRIHTNALTPRTCPKACTRPEDPRNVELAIGA